MKYWVHRMYAELFPEPDPPDIETELADGFYSDGTAERIDLNALMEPDTPFANMFRMLLQAQLEMPDDAIGIEFTAGPEPKLKGYIK